VILPKTIRSTQTLFIPKVHSADVKTIGTQNSLSNVLKGLNEE